jgi:hypothetical protein
VTSTPSRPERRALLELEALALRLEELSAAGDEQRFLTDDVYRWTIHRLWIAVGNEALLYTRLAGLNVKADQPWAALYQLRCALAHDPLPDLDDMAIWRATSRRPEELRNLVRTLLR